MGPSLRGLPGHKPGHRACDDSGLTSPLLLLKLGQSKQTVGALVEIVISQDKLVAARYMTLSQKSNKDLGGDRVAQLMTKFC